MKWYGSVNNRLEEGKQFVKEIKVGDGVTEYSYSDRDAYEVIEVRDQRHITIREYDHKLKGEPFTNDWELISNPNNRTIDLVKRGANWYTSATCTRADLEEIEDRREKETKDGGKLTDATLNLIMWACQFDHDKVMKNGKQTKYNKMNISIGRAEYYYDYSF